MCICINVSFDCVYIGIYIFLYIFLYILLFVFGIGGNGISISLSVHTNGKIDNKVDFDFILLRICVYLSLHVCKHMSARLLGVPGRRGAEPGTHTPSGPALGPGTCWAY